MVYNFMFVWMLLFIDENYSGLGLDYPLSLPLFESQLGRECRTEEIPSRVGLALVIPIYSIQFLSFPF